MMAADKFGIYGVSIWKIMIVVSLVGALSLPVSVRPDSSFIANSGSAPHKMLSGRTNLPSSPPPGPSPLATIFSDGFESDLGWTGYGSTSEWERGSPVSGACGSGVGDPSAAHGGTKVIGNDLTGTGSYLHCYENSIAVTNYLTSPTISTVGYTGLTVSFWRALGVETSTYDHAYFQAYDGSSWTTLFSNSATLNENTWTQYSYSLAASFEGKTNVQFRFGLGTTDSSAVYQGWNIDDFLLTGTSTNQPPATPTLSTPWDFQKGGPWTSTLRPQFNFSTTDPEGNTINYNIQVSTDPNFGSTVINAVSGIDTGFSGTPPYTSGASVVFTAQSDLASGTTYWWKVRATDPGGSATWSSFSSSRSVTVQSGQTEQSWFQTIKEQFDRNTLAGASSTTTYLGGDVEVIAAPGSWIQTSQADFNAGTLYQVETTSSPGNVKLAGTVYTPGLSSDNAGAQPTIQTIYVQSDASYTIPCNGEVTSWSYYNSASALTTPNSELEFLTGSGTTWTVQAKSPAVTVGPGTNTFSVSIPVSSGWQIGAYIGDTNRPYYDTTSGIVYRRTSGSGDLVVGGTGTDFSSNTPRALPIVVTMKCYYSSGTLTSSVFNAGAGTAWGTISWTHTIPSGTAISYQTRTGPTPTPDASWSAWSTSYASSGSSITSPSNQYIQYLASFSTASSSYTPVLADVTITYTASTAGSVTTTAMNYAYGPSSQFSWGSIAWNMDITHGSITIAVQKYTTSWVWTGVQSASNPIDISSLGSQSQIRLVANLTYSGGTPKLLDWEVSWITSVVPQILSLDVRHAGSSIGDGGKLYAGLIEEFVVEARDPQGQTDIQYVDLRLDGTTNYIARWTQGGTFTKQAGGSYFDIDPSSSATYASDKWTISYKIKFAWNLPWANMLVTPVVYVIDKESNTAIQTFGTKTYIVVNNLIFSGTLTATGQYQGALSSGSWVRGGESITWTGLTVYYSASTVSPLDSDFDIRIRDNDGTTWTQTTGSALNLVTTADLTNKTSDIHTIDIINVPGGGPHGSTTYEIKIDNEKPAKPLTVTATPSGWTSTNSFSVDWTNPADLSGIVTGTRYKLDFPPTSDTDGTWVATKPITSISVSGDGSHTIYVWLKDAVGNVNYLNYNSTNLLLDGGGAVFSSYSVWNGSAWVAVSGWIRSQTPNVCIQVQVMYSGIDKPNARYYHSENGGSSWSSALSVTGVGTACGLNDAADGTTATVYVTVNGVPFNQDSDTQNQVKFDVLSKSNVVRQSTAATIKVDSIAPGVPASLTATPSGWTNVNSFSINWNNPADLSGIAGGYYKLSAPTGNGDGTWSTSKPISGVTVPGEGTYTLYLYLKDNAGNTNYLSTSTVSLYYDATAPNAPTGVIADGSSPSPWKNVSSFSIDWTPPVGDLSGIAGWYYKMYSPPSAPTDGTYSTSKPFIAAPPTDGPLTLYLWMKDNAGNADHTKRGTVTIRYDGTPPTTIGDLSSPKATGTTIKLAWSIPIEPNFLKYEIYYATHSGITISDKKWDDSNDSGLLSLTGNTTTITGLSPSSTYYFRIRAIDLASNKAVLSNEIITSTGIQQTKWHLYNGANFVAVTCNPPSWTAYTLGKSITQNITPGKTYEIMRWNANIQSWESVISTNGIDWYGTDFPVIKGGGYVVRVSGVASGGIDYTFSGTEVLNPVNLVLHKDSVLIGIPFSNTTYKACLLLQRIKEQNSLPTTESVEVQWWDPLKGSYVGSTYTYFFGEWTCTLTDDNFIIQPEHGYFIKITQSGIFNP
jgi:hypothetical protein